MKLLRYLAKGFILNGCNCGLKEREEDIAIIYSEQPCKAAGMFTRNKLKGEPVLWSLKNINNRIKAIIINSKYANVACGEEGKKLLQNMVENLSKSLNIPLKSILVASTGIIGKLPPFDRIKIGTETLVNKIRNKENDIFSCVKAIMTTDRKMKISYRLIRIDGKMVRIFGFAKGAGMISPNLATMLCFLLTDASITKKALRKSLKDSVEISFNRITVDNETSPSDTVIILANGCAKNKIINTKNLNKNYKKFKKALEEVCLDLAKKIIKDAEGATKFITVKIINSPNKKIAEDIAKSVANSLLVKTAIHGEDQNYGRILSACCNAVHEFNTKKINVYVNEKKVISNSVVMQKFFKNPLRNKRIEILIDLKSKKRFTTTYYTCDLSEEYVRLNSSYTT